MANTFAEKATKYTQILDIIFQKEAKTAFLEMNPLNVQFNGTRFVKMPQITTDGAADYDRGAGYNQGSVSVSYSNYELKYDRGRRFDIDVLDDDEAAFNVFTSAAQEYVRTKEIPEIDAVRFAEMADQAANVVEADLTTGYVDAYDEAELVLNDNEAGDQRIMFVSYEFLKGLKQDPAIERKINAGDVSVNGINRRVELLDGQVPLIGVPKGRFYDVITLNDGVTAGQEQGGFTPTAGVSKPINFIYADKSILNAIVKRKVSKVIMAEANQTADANSVYYRFHHDLIIPTLRRNGIYVHKAATAVA